MHPVQSPAAAQEIANDSHSPRVGMSSHHKTHRKIVYKRLLVQLTFIFVHVALIKFAIPNILWAVIGLVFWGSLVYAASRSGRWVCSTFCWLGGIQDIMFPFAKKRVSFNPKISQYAMLILLVVWVPLAWLFHQQAVFDMSESPLHNPFSSDENLLVQGGHFLILTLVGLGVTVFGARGMCHYFCPFGIVVQFFKNRRLKRRNAASATNV